MRQGEVLPQKLSLAQGHPSAQSLPGILWAFAAMKWSEVRRRDDFCLKENLKTFASQWSLSLGGLTLRVAFKHFKTLKGLCRSLCLSPCRDDA